MKTKNLNQQYSLFILLCLFTGLTRAGLSDLIHTDPWKLLQDKFIIAPNARASQTMPTIAKSIVGLGVGIGTGWIAKKLHKNYLKVKKNDPLASEFQLSVSSRSYYSIIPAAIAAGCFAYYKLHNVLVISYQQDQLIDLLNNWPQVKSRIPSQLQQGLEEIYKDYLANPRDFSYKSADITRVLIQQINEKLEDKTYRKFWGAKAFTSNIILDIRNTIASFSNIFK